MVDVQGGGTPYVGTHYGDTSIAEDVTDIIYQITPEDTPVFNTTGDTVSNGVFHQWQTRAISGRAHNANYEGFTYAFTGGMNLPDARRFNITQIFNKHVRVSETQVALSHYGIDNVFNDQMMMRMAEIKMDHEHAIINATVASGATGTARKMQGLINAIVSGVSTYTTYAAGVSLTESQFNDFIQTCWQYGSKPKDWYAGGYLKRKISGFTTGNTKFIAAESMKQVNVISVLETDFFTANIHLCRDVPIQSATGAFSGYTGYGLLGLDVEMVKKAWLRPLTAERAPKTADSYDGVIKSEMTVEWGHPNAHYYLHQSI